MLPERITQLLSAYVDGELSSRERRAVTRLLRKSQEARLLLHQLKKDSMILRRLPRRKTQLDLSGSVMGTISLRNIQLPKIASTAATQKLAIKAKPRPWWLRLALAAVVLLAVGLASYYAVSLLLNPNVAGHTGPEPSHADDTPGQGAVRPEQEKPLPAVTLVHEPTPVPPGAAQLAPKDDRSHLRTVRVPALATPQPRLMAILNLRDLEQAPSVLQVNQELRKDSASRLDLFCLTDTRKALDRLQSVLKSRNVTLRIDSFAQARIKQVQRTNFALYTEDLGPDDWSGLLQQLAVADRQAGSPVFDKLTVNPLTATELAKVLGGDPSYYHQPEQKGPLGVDISQDVSSRTGAQIVQNLTGQGAAGAQAVLVPYGLPQPGFSQEVRNLVEYRRGWKPGAIQVLLVLWNNN